MWRFAQLRDTARIYVTGLPASMLQRCLLLPSPFTIKLEYGAL